MSEEALLSKARESAAGGDKQAARAILDGLVMDNPDNELAWLLLAELVYDSNEIADCLRQVLRINPNNPVALEKYTSPDKPETKLDLDHIDKTPLFRPDEPASPATEI
jgi:hypothetical protein